MHNNAAKYPGTLEQTFIKIGTEIREQSLFTR
jgi:hypothetical protein